MIEGIDLIVHRRDAEAIAYLKQAETPDAVDIDAAEALVTRVRETNTLTLAGQRRIAFDAERANGA